MSNKFTALLGRKMHSPIAAGKRNTSPFCEGINAHPPCSTSPAPPMHTSTRGSPATPTANGDCPRRRHSRKCSQSNSFSRSTGVDDSTTGVDPTNRTLGKVDAGNCLIHLEALAAGPSSRQHGPSHTSETSHRCFVGSRTPRHRRPKSEPCQPSEIRRRRAAE